MIQLHGQRFGKLVVVEEGPRGNGVSRQSRRWWCVCDCDHKRCLVAQSDLRVGKQVSCGCHRNQKARDKATHGMSGTEEYTTWILIKRRCYNPSDADYKDYGGRGIVVCDRWLHDFGAFYKDMGSRPSRNHSIDRRNTNGNYDPDNCRWATPTEQARNKRTSVRHSYNGQSLTIAEWSEVTGIPYSILRSRISNGWNPVVAITTPWVPSNYGRQTNRTTLSMPSRSDFPEPQLQLC